MNARLVVILYQIMCGARQEVISEPSYVLTPRFSDFVLII